MTKRPDPAPEEERSDIRRKLRQAVEIQGILRDGKGPPGSPSGSRPAPARRAPSETFPTDSPAPPGDLPAPAARVEPRSISHVPPPEEPDLFEAPSPAARVHHSWQRDPSSSESLGALHDDYARCRRCPLGESRTSFVFGVGNPQASVVFVGEAPGRDEDLQGEPFVGRAGKLLDKILAAIEWRRDEVYIANILKCRPPGNRNPEATEIASCEPILRRQIELIRPVILCTLGSIAARVLLGTTQGISKLRGRLHHYRGIPVVPTYHPAALLRNPAWKRPTWEDVRMLRREHDRLLGEASRPSGGG